MSRTTVYVCEAQPIVVEGLTRVFATTGDLELMGWTTTLGEVMPRLLEHRPKVVLVDQASGLKAFFRFCEDLKAAAPDVHPVLWSTELAEVECFRALQMGARGIIRKTQPVDHLIDCIREVARGNIWLESAASEQLDALVQRRGSPRLTPREREIVRCLCRGLRNKEIARELSITPGTVKVHLMHVFEKTGVKDRFELALHGRRLLGGSEAEEPVGAAGAERN